MKFKPVETLEDYADRLQDSVKADRAPAARRQMNRSIVEAVRTVSQARDWRCLRAVFEFSVPPEQSSIPITVTANVVTRIDSEDWPSWAVGQDLIIGNEQVRISEVDGTSATIGTDLPSVNASSVAELYQRAWDLPADCRLVRDVRIGLYHVNMTTESYDFRRAGALLATQEAGPKIRFTAPPRSEYAGRVVYDKWPIQSEVVQSQFTCSGTSGQSTVTLSSSFANHPGLVFRLAGNADSPTNVNGRLKNDVRGSSEPELLNPFIFESEVISISGATVTLADALPSDAVAAGCSLSSRVSLDDHISRAVDFRARAHFTQVAGNASGGFYAAAENALREAYDADPAGIFTAAPQSNESLVDHESGRRAFYV